MAIEFKLPDIGEGVAEGEIVRWIVKEGDAIKEDQPMVEVMTDKATVEIGSPITGRVAQIKAKEGQVVPVHSVIVILEEGGAAPKAAPAPAKEAAPAAPAAKPAPAAPAKPAAAPAAAAPAAPAAVVAPVAEGPILAAPATRKLAREHGIDLAAVPASGDRGRVTHDDVLAFLQGGAKVAAAAPAAPAMVEAPAAPAAAPAASAAPAKAPSAATLPVRRDFAAGATETVAYRGIRKATGDQMVRSAYSAPHFTYGEEFEFSALNDLRKRASEMGKEFGVKVTFLPFIVKALCAAIRRFPTVNAELREAEGQILVKKDIHVGIATDTDRGLMVPVVRHADKLSILEIASEMQRLTEAARTGKATREELTGSTITITSAGSIGGLFATPIINHPEVAILGVFQMKDKPVIKDGAIVPGKVAVMTLTLDHRVIDGGTAAHFMNHMKRLLEDPTMLILAV